MLASKFRNGKIRAIDDVVMLMSYLLTRFPVSSAGLAALAQTWVIRYNAKMYVPFILSSKRQWLFSVSL